MSAAGLLRRIAARAGRVLRPIFNPDGEQQSADLAAIRIHTAAQARELERQHDELAKLRAAAVDQRKTDAGDMRRELEAHREAVRDLQKRVEHLQAHDVERLNARFTGLRASVDRQAKFASKALSRSEALPRWILDEQRSLDRLARLAKSGQPIVVGPWTGEVGFELLYWAPFVRWALAHYDIDPRRVTIVSRGGTESWYGVPSGYEDALRIFTPEQFRAGSEDVKKQRAFRPFDRQLVRRLRRERGPFRLLHPSLMYDMFWPYWREELTYRHVLRYSHQRLVTPPEVPGVTDTLPREFAAVRFYFSSCFPETPENRALVESIIRSLSERSDVVLLGSGLQLDDHREYAEGSGYKVHVVTGRDEPHRNLALQTAVIGRARRFVGTYGGFSYLAPYLGVDSLALYSVRNFRMYHLELAQRLFDSLGGGALMPIDAAKTGLIADALATPERLADAAAKAMRLP